MTIEESISKLKIDLIRKRPFYGVILMKLNELKESDSTDIVCTDGSTIFYNREYMENLTESERNFYLLHQLYHCIFMHPTRMVNKDSKVANVAADYLVNHYISIEKEEFKKSGINISYPKDILILENEEDKKMLDELSFEKVYEILYKQSKKSSQSKDNKIEEDSKSLGEDIDYKKVKEDIKRPRNSQKTSSDMRRIIQESITINNMQNKNMGDMPGNLIRKIEILVGVRLPWYKHLRRYLSNIVNDDLSFDTPDKNHIYRELVLPGVYEDEHKLKDILFVIDTSGSIDDESLSKFMSHSYSICKEFDASGKIIFFDSAVQDVFEIDKTNFRKIRPVGGEGTNVDSAFEYIRDEKLRYICIVVLTDGYFPKPNILLRNVIWCITENGDLSSVENYKGSKIIKV